MINDVLPERSVGVGVAQRPWGKWLICMGDGAGGVLRGPWQIGTPLVMEPGRGCFH